MTAEMTEGRVTRRFSAPVVLLFPFFLVMALWASILSAEPVTSGAGEDPGFKACQERLEALLGPIGGDWRAVQFQFEVTAGTTFLGSGSVSLARDKWYRLELFSRTSTCLFQHQLGTSSCYLANEAETLLFQTGSNEHVPVPIIVVDKAEDGGYHLDFQMNLQTVVGSQPVKVHLNPEVSGYIVRRLKEKFPVVAWGTEIDTFSLPNAATPSVTLYKKENRIHGCQAWFPREGKPPIGLKFSNFVVNQPLEQPPVSRVFANASIPEGRLETIYGFIKSFSALLADFLPRENE